jgi:hypothetical protein
MMRLAGNVTRLGNACRVLVEKLEKKRPLGRPRLYGEIILKWSLDKSQRNTIGLIYFGRDRDQ